jgi:uncharacterized Zn-finger protein
MIRPLSDICGVCKMSFAGPFDLADHISSVHPLGKPIVLVPLGIRASS